MYISIIALGQQTIRTKRSAILRFNRNRFVEDLIDLEVRITIKTRTFPITPTASTRLKIKHGVKVHWQLFDKLLFTFGTF